MRQLETADLRRMRAGERAALAAEELALDEVRRERGAVDDYERTGTAHAAAVDRAREQFFAGARFARQQDSGVGRCHLVDPEHHVAKRIAVADDRVAIVGGGQGDRSGRVGAAERGDAGELAVLGNGWKRHNTLTRARAPRSKCEARPKKVRRAHGRAGRLERGHGPAADRRGESAGRRNAILHEVSRVKRLDYGRRPVRIAIGRGGGRIPVGFRPTSADRAARPRFGHNCSRNVKYFAPFRLDLTGRTLWRDGVRVPLTHKAFDLLAVLVERAGHVVAKETLLETVWPQTHVHPDNVKVLIGEVRRALGDDPMRPRFIRSLVKRGYIFIAPVVDADGRPHRQLVVSDLRRARSGDGSAARRARPGRRLASAGGLRHRRRRNRQDRPLRGVPPRRGDAPRHAGDVGTVHEALGTVRAVLSAARSLTRLARSTEDELVTATLARHAPSWLPHLPALSDDAPRAFTAGTHVATAARMLREIVTALETLAEDTPLVLWIEDLQWADPATIDVLASLGQRRDPAKLLLLATIRSSDSGAASAPLRRTQVDLLARPQTMELRLQPLSRQDVARYLDVQLGEEVSRQSSSVLYHLTSGNPLFLVTAIEHLVRKGYFADGGEGWRLEVSPDALEAAIPASLVGTVARELEELAPDERQAIDAASVVGVEFSLWLAAHAANMDELALEPVLEMLARRRTFIVREGVVELANGVFSPLYRFTHGLYQEIVIDHVQPAARAAAHARAGLAMERVFTGREHEAAADLACHFHGAGDHLRAARYLRVAAGNALRRYAPREAGALLHGAVTHAAHLAPDERARVEIPLMLELGEAQLAAGETDLGHPDPDRGSSAAPPTSAGTTTASGRC